MNASLAPMRLIDIQATVVGTSGLQTYLFRHHKKSCAATESTSLGDAKVQDPERSGTVSIYLNGARSPGLAGRHRRSR